MKTSNPTLSSEAFYAPGWSRGQTGTDRMTVQGVVVKTAILLFLALMSAGWVWMKFSKAGADLSSLNGWMWGSAIGGFVLALATTFKQAWAPITAPLYAVVEGVFIGAISLVLEASFPGIVLQAATCTFGTLAAMLFAYQSGFIQVTDTFRKVVVTATLGIAISYLIMIALSFFGVSLGFFTGNSLLSIGLSLFVIGIAALNFILDFDFIEKAAYKGSPKYMDWYGAFALMVTLVWLYIEFLRLLSKLRSR